MWNILLKLFYLIERMDHNNDILRNYFGYLDLPILEFGKISSSHDNAKKLMNPYLYKNHI